MKIDKGKAFATILLASLVAASLLTSLWIPVSAGPPPPPPGDIEWKQKPPAYDYAWSGVPDFDQKQDDWNGTATVSYPLWAMLGAGWGFTPFTIAQPGPTLRAVLGDTVNLTLASADGLPHEFHLDYDNDFVVDPGEPHLPAFVGPTVFLFTVTKSSAPGAFTYRCGTMMPGHAESGAFVVNPRRWSWCGPVAVANSLWWWDSHIDGWLYKNSAPPTVSDHFPLVQNYGPWDDHDPRNVVPFVTKLAGLMKTDVGKSGTNVFDMQAGIRAYLEAKGLNMSFYERTWKPCTFEFIDLWREFEKCEDVVLLLGFYEEQRIDEPPYYKWVRVGGHYVTVAGVGNHSTGYWIKLSDPFLDYAESMGWDSTYVPIAHPAHPWNSAVHNNATLVSHDPYMIIGPPGLPLPGIHFGIENYPVSTIITQSGLTENGPGNPFVPNGTYRRGSVYTGVEYMVTFSPTQYDKPAYVDYAPSKMPDFDQKQDAWWNPVTLKWSWCGPVAVANSLWWLDSKFEPGNTPPPTISDGFPLVQSYGAWDDHDVRNVGPFISRLATLMQTDVGKNGTDVHDMEAGIRAYLAEKGLSGMFYERTWHCNFTFADIEYEVEKSEDVILLLGLYELQEVKPGVYMWVRIGGHYVTVSGVNANGTIKFSDPALDWAEAAGGGQGEVLPPGHMHPPVPRAFMLHNNTLYVSHDYYSIISGSPIEGVHWGIDGYPWPYVYWDITPQGEPVYPYQGITGQYFTGVEYAVIVSPLEVHDVAVISVTPMGLPGFNASIPGCNAAYAKWHPTWTYGFYIEVVVKNRGTFTENNVVVKLFNDSSLIGSTLIASFARGAQLTLNFPWTPIQNLTYPTRMKGYPWPYPTRTNIKANITVVLGDVNPANNQLNWGTLTIKYPGDAGKVVFSGGQWVYTPGDGKVWVEDLYLFGKFGWGADRGEYKYDTLGFWCDYNHDGKVYVEDLQVMGKTWGAKPIPGDGIY